MRGLVPTTLLPALPRAQYTLDPLQPEDLLNYMNVLKELYMPPIHGGFTAADVNLDTTPADVNYGQNDDGSPKRLKKSRTLSGGSVDLVPGLGLEMDGLALQEDVIAEEADSDIEHFVDSDYDDDDEDDDDAGANDPFERDWAEKWLGGVIRRAQNWIEGEGDAADSTALAEMEAILREATAVLAMMAGTSAAGSLTRHLVFPLAPELAPALRALRPSLAAANPLLSPETTSFLAKLATSPASPLTTMRPLARRARSNTASTTGSLGKSPTASTVRKRPVLPVLLHDAPMGDHLSVGVQTWGSAILLGREMALRPADFGVFPPPHGHPHGGGTRVLELGAGTGLLSILCRKLLDLRAAQDALDATTSPDPGLIVATDFHPDVLANLRVCVDLNAPPRLPTTDAGRGIEIAKLDWMTFPSWMEARTGLRSYESKAADATVLERLAAYGQDGDEVSASKDRAGRVGAFGATDDEEELEPFVDTAFDLVLASDCVYDPTHAAMLREVAGWVLRLPTDTDPGGTFHILSPIRPTFTPELESIDEHFLPAAGHAPLAARQAAAAAATAAGSSWREIEPRLRGEGLGTPLGLQLVVRGEGKRSVTGRRGEGRVDEVAGYWWWEVGWA